MRLTGKNAVVTGASSGMGRAIVELFVQEGANVVAVARRRERLEELAASLVNAPGRVLVYPGDISARETNEGMINACVDEFGALDIVVNNAGVMDDMAPIGQMTDERYRHVMEVNVYGPMCAMRHAVTVFQHQGNGGAIINIASVGAIRSVAGTAYCASKAALVSISKHTAFMYMPDHIRVNTILPGGIDTEIATSMGKPNADGYGRVGKILAAAPAPGDPSAIAHAALYLASDESSYVSGAQLTVDGGWIAG